MEGLNEQALTNEELARLSELCERASPEPWTAIVEGRDQLSGDSFIMVGPPDAREEDMYVSRESSAASAADLDFIAGARTYMRRLLGELMQLREAQRDK